MDTAAAQKKEESKLKSILPLIAATIAVLGPAAYLVGLNFYQGYMGAFGIEVASSEIATPDVYINSYNAFGLLLFALTEPVANFFQSILLSPKVYYVLLIFCLLTLVVYAIIKFRKSPTKLHESSVLKRTAAFSRRFHWDNNDFTMAAIVVGIVYYLFISLFFVLGSATFWWWLLPVGPHQKGESVAREQIKLYQDKGCHANKKTGWNNCVSVVDGNGVVLYEGLLIMKNDKEVAIFQADCSYIIKLQDDYVLRRHFHTPAPV